MKKTELILSKGGEEVVQLNGVEFLSFERLEGGHISTNMGEVPSYIENVYCYKYNTDLIKCLFYKGDKFSVKRIDAGKVCFGVALIKQITPEVIIECRFRD